MTLETRRSDPYAWRPDSGPFWIVSIFGSALVARLVVKSAMMFGLYVGESLG